MIIIFTPILFGIDIEAFQKSNQLIITCLEYDMTTCIYLHDKIKNTKYCLKN